MLRVKLYKAIFVTLFVLSAWWLDSTIISSNNSLLNNMQLNELHQKLDFLWKIQELNGIEEKREFFSENNLKFKAIGHDSYVAENEFNKPKTLYFYLFLIGSIILLAFEIIEVFIAKKEKASNKAV